MSKICRHLEKYTQEAEQTCLNIDQTTTKMIQETGGDFDAFAHCRRAREQQRRERERDGATE